MELIKFSNFKDLLIMSYLPNSLILNGLKLLQRLLSHHIQINYPFKQLGSHYTWSNLGWGCTHPWYKVKTYTRHTPHKRLRLMTSLLQSLQLTDQIQTEDQTWYLRFYSCQMRRHEKAISKITSLWFICDLVTIYRPYTKWGPSLAFQVLELLLSNFIKYIGITKGLYK